MGKNVLKGLLTVLMAMTSVNVYAEEPTASPTEGTVEGNTTSTEAPVESSEPTESPTAEPTSEPVETVQPTSEPVATSEPTPEATEEATKEPEATESPSAETQENQEEKEKSVTRVLVGVSDESLIAEDVKVLGSYNGAYLLEYATEEEANQAVEYYASIGNFAEIDTDVVINGVEGYQLEYSEENNPLTKLANLASDSKVGADKYGVVGLIDTGANEGTLASVSLVDDYPADNNGHGTTMIQNIKEGNANAEVLSIKALNNDGVGSIASIYASIEYAIEQEVDVINLSMIGYSNASKSAIEYIVNKAVENGIVVVGASGDYTDDGNNYIPTKIDNALVVAACTEDGLMLDTTNYAETIDLQVVADSSEIAAAKLTGIVSFNMSYEMSPLAYLPVTVSMPNAGDMGIMTAGLDDYTGIDPSLTIDGQELVYFNDLKDYTQQSTLVLNDGVTASDKKYVYDVKGDNTLELKKRYNATDMPEDHISRKVYASGDKLVLWQPNIGTYKGEKVGALLTLTRMSRGDLNDQNAPFILSLMPLANGETSASVGDGIFNLYTENSALTELDITLYKNAEEAGLDTTTGLPTSGEVVNINTNADFFFAGATGLTNEGTQKGTIEFYSADSNLSDTRLYPALPDNYIGHSPLDEYGHSEMTAWYSTNSNVNDTSFTRNSTFLSNIKNENSFKFYVGILGPMNTNADFSHGDPTMWFRLTIAANGLPKLPTEELPDPEITKSQIGEDGVKLPDDYLSSKTDFNFQYQIDVKVPELNKEGGYYKSLVVTDKVDEFVKLLSDVKVGVVENNKITEDATDKFNITVSSKNEIKVEMKPEELVYDDVNGNKNYGKTYRIYFDVHKLTFEEMTADQQAKWIETHPDWKIKNSASVVVHKMVFEEDKGHKTVETPPVTITYPHGLVIHYLEILDKNGDGIEDTPDDPTDNTVVYKTYEDATKKGGDKYSVVSPDLEGGYKNQAGELSEYGLRHVYPQKVDNQCTLTKDNKTVAGEMPSDYYELYVYYKPHLLTVSYLEKDTNVKLWTDYKDPTVGKDDDYYVESPTIAGYELVNPSENVVIGTMPSDKHHIDVYYDKTPMVGSQITVYKSSEPVTQTTVKANDTIRYTLTVKNTGVTAYTGIVVTDNVPIGTEFVSAEDGGTLADGIVTWKVDALAARQETTVHFTVKVKEGFNSIVYNSGYWYSNEDPTVRETNLTIHPTQEAVNQGVTGPANLQAVKGGTVSTTTTTVTTPLEKTSGTQTFSYQQGTQSFTAPMDGTYRFTLYGAQGGDAERGYIWLNRGPMPTVSGIPGDVVTVDYEMQKGQTVYIVTGGKGGTGNSGGCEIKMSNGGRWGSQKIPWCNDSAGGGGYNGGGSGGKGYASSRYGYYENGECAVYGGGAGGGGATQLTTTNRGTLNNFTSYTGEVIAVAGGGGGEHTGSNHGVGAIDHGGSTGSYGRGGNGGRQDLQHGGGGAGSGTTANRGGNLVGDSGTSYVGSMATKVSQSTENQGNGKVTVTWDITVKGTPVSSTTTNTENNGTIYWDDTTSESSSTVIENTSEGLVTYSVQLANNGSQVAKDSVLTDEIPEGTEFVSAQDGGTYNASKNRVEWYLGNLASGESKTVHFTVKITGTTKLIQNQARFDREITKDKLSTSNPKHGTNIVEHLLVNDLTVVKQWVKDDETNRPSSITVHVKGNDGTNLTGTLSKDNGWTYSFKGVNLASGTVYTVYEDVPAGYTSNATSDKPITVNGNVVKIVNTKNVIEIPVKKIWSDNNDVAGVRPGFITVNLYKDNDRNTILKTLTLTAANATDANTWEGKFTDIPAMDASGYVIEYAIKEDAVKYYTIIYKNNAGQISFVPNAGFNTIVNTRVQEGEEKVDITKNVYNDAGTNIDGRLVQVGDTLHYVLTLTNTGDLSTTVTVTDQIPEHTELLSIDNDGVENNGVITWSDVYVQAHGRTTLSFNVKAVDEGIKIVNQAILIDKKGNQKESNEVVNYTPKTPVKELTSASGLIDLNGKSVKVNDILTFKITVENTTETTREFIVKDIVPAYTEFVSADENGKLSNGEVAWKFNLDAGAKRTVSFKVKVVEFGNIENKAVQILDEVSTNSNTVTAWQGRIIINKQINEYYAPYGDPSFAYSITDQAGNISYRMIQIKNEHDGTTTFIAPTGMTPDAVFAVDEMSNSRYSFVKLWSVSNNVTVAGSKATVTLNAENNEAEVNYINTIKNWSETSHQTSVINHFGK